jgi:hypothetical protein
VIANVLLRLVPGKVVEGRRRTAPPLMWSDGRLGSVVAFVALISVAPVLRISRDFAGFCRANSFILFLHQAIQNS